MSRKTIVVEYLKTKYRLQLFPLSELIIYYL